MAATISVGNNGREAAVAKRYTTAAQERQAVPVAPFSIVASTSRRSQKKSSSGITAAATQRPTWREGETVLDLGSGGGKACYILSQVVGREGRVIGVDCNQEMLDLARRYHDTVAQRIGYENVDFCYAMIQDLALDLELLAEETHGLQIHSPQDWLNVRQVEQQLRRQRPMIPDDSVDCVVSNCVLNLVRPEDRRQLFSEVFRVLRLGGRAAISDIVADEDVPEHLQNDPELWSGLCLRSVPGGPLFEGIRGRGLLRDSDRRTAGRAVADCRRVLSSVR